MLKWNRLLLFTSVWVCLLTALPYIYSVIKIEPSRVWTPVNSEDLMCSDSRFYAAGIRELGESFFHHSNPVSQGQRNFLVDKFRMSTYQLTYLMGGWLTDTRFSIVLGLLGGVLASFILIYLVGFYLGMRGPLALSISLLTLFFVGVFDSLSRLNFMEFSDYVLERISLTQLTVWPDRLSETFRYVIMSGANIYLWGCILGLVFLLRRKYIAAFLILIPLVFLLPRVYLAVTLFSYLLLGCCWIFEFKDKNIRYGLGILGLVSLASLFLTSFVVDISEIRQQGLGVIAQAHLGKTKTSIFEGFIRLFLMIIPIALSLLLVGRRKPENKSIWNVTFYFFFSLLLLGILMESFGYSHLFMRLMQRGGNYIWVYLFFTCVFCVFPKKMDKWVYVFSFLLCSLASIQVARTSYSNSMTSIAKDRWQVYQFFSGHDVANKLVFSTDFRDIQLLPVFTDLDLVTPGAEFLEDSKEQVSKYVAILRLLGLSTESLRDSIDIYPKNELLNSCLSSRNEIIDMDKGNFYLLKQLMYDPIVKYFGDVPIRTPEGALAQDFRDVYAGLFVEGNRESGESNMDWANIDYIVLFRDEYRLIKWNVDRDFEKVFENGLKTILRKRSRLHGP